MRFILAIGLLLATCGVAIGQDPGESNIKPYGGRQIRFSTPHDGERIVAGDSISIELVAEEGVDLEWAMVAFTGGGLPLSPPFKAKLKIPNDAIGEMELSALGTTSSGEMVASNKVVIIIVVGDAKLFGIECESGEVFLGGIGCVRNLYITGTYTDGVERDLSRKGALYSVVEGHDVACVTDDGVVIGRSPGRATVAVTYGEHVLEVPVAVHEEDCPNNPPQAKLAELIEAKVGEEICLDAGLSRDFDSCLGETLPSEEIVWKVKFEDSTHEGSGSEFCFTPAGVGDGVVVLSVTDGHGASSQAFSTVEVR